MVPLGSNILCLFIFIFYTQKTYIIIFYIIMGSISFDEEDEIGEFGLNDNDSDGSPSADSEDAP